MSSASLTPAARAHSRSAASAHERAPRVHRRLLVAVLALALASLAAPPVASVAAPLVVLPATAVSPPANAAHEYGNAQLAGVSCPSAGRCWAIGLYKEESGEAVPMLAAESEGEWHSEAVTAAAAGSLHAISCVGGGACAEVGTRLEAGGGSPVVVSEAAGRAGEASALAIAPPEDESPGVPKGGFDAIACPAAGACVAVGSYDGATHEELPMVAVQEGGIWPATAQALAPLAGSGGGGLRAISCVGVDACTAVGYTVERPLERGFAVELTAGGWQAPVEIPAANPGTPTKLDGVSCTGADECSAVGGEVSGIFEGAAIRAVETEGGWRSEDVTYQGAPPSDASLSAISCASVRDCAAVGVEDLEVEQDAAIARESEGTWTAMGAVTLPTPRASTGALDSISCASADECTAVGTYDASKTEVGAMAVSVVPELSMATTALPGATVGTPYRAQLLAAGGSGRYRWEVSGGELPAGLTLDPATGVISGTPSAARSETVTVKLTTGPPAQQLTRRLTIDVGPALSPAKAEAPPAQPPAGAAQAPPARSTTPLLSASSARMASLTILASRPARHGRVAKLRLACADARCAGKLTVSAIVTVRMRSNGSELRRHVRVVLARGRYALRADARRTATLRLTARGRRLVDGRVRRRRLPLLVRVAATLAGGRAEADATLWG